MKYAVFAIAAAGTLPLSILLYVDRRFVKYAIWAMVAAMCAYTATSINFYSDEEYRGSARGMEVSAIHLMAFAVLAAAALRRRLKPVPDIGYFIYTVYFLLCLPSLSTAADGLIAWYEIWKMIMLYASSLAVFAYLEGGGKVRGLVAAFACFSIVNAAVVVKQHFGGMYQARGVFPHQNCMTMAMSLLAPVFLAVYLQGGLRGRFRKLCAAAFLCALLSIAWSYSRGGVVAAPAGCAVTVFAFFLKGARRGKTCLRLLPLFLAALAGIAAVLPRIVERFEKAPEASANTRVEFARCAWEMIKDEPVTGVGINNWGIKINAPYEYATRAGRTLNYAEGYKDGIVETVYLLVCAECGIPALVAMLAWFLRYLVLCVVLSKKLSGTYYAAIPAGLAGGLVACYLQSFLEWVLRQQMNLILLMVFFALLDHLAANVSRLKNETKTKGSGNV